MKDVLSQLFAIMRPHARFVAEANAYVDGELTPSRRERFDTHLLRCEECAQEVAEVRGVKTLLAALPAEAAPRSFRLTTAMVSLPAAPIQRPRSTAPLRFAQGATALATFALLTVVSVGVMGSGSSQSTTAGGSNLKSSAESTGAVSNAAVPAQDSGAPAVSQATGATAERGGGGTVALGSPATAAPPAERFAAGATPASGPPGAPLTGVASKSDSSGAVEGPNRDTAPTTSAAADDGISGRRWLELSLLIVAIVAGAAWLGLSRRTRRDYS